MVNVGNGANNNGTESVERMARQNVAHPTTNNVRAGAPPAVTLVVQT